MGGLMSLKLTATSVLLIAMSSAVACGGAHMSPTVVGIFVSPRSATAWSNSAEDHIVYKIVVGYSDGRDVPLTSGVEWQVRGSWVSFDSGTATATCKNPAPQNAFNIPEPATITVTATLGGQTFRDKAILDCF